MKKLCYQSLKEQHYPGYFLENAPERVLQFGEGNFLRAFVDYFIDILNEKTDFQSKVVLCQPIASGLRDRINEQEGLYTLYLRGFENGQKVNQKRVISCVSRCLNPYEEYASVLACAKNPDLRYIVCNTTEAGIVYQPSCQFTDVPADSYPGKLTQFLYERFLHFGKEPGKGFVILSCELIDNNGKELEKCVLQYASQWKLGEDFEKWVRSENIFCSTLVDRIVTGYPRGEAETLCQENGYLDQLLTTGEIFGFWVIEGPQSLKDELPFAEAGLPVLITDDHKPYKQRKVRILNGAHTSMVLGAYLAGQNIVRDCMENETILSFMNQAIYKEIIPTLTLPEEELTDFAFSVTERFKNPFIDHQLLSIALNSTSKWKARVLPSVKGYIDQFHCPPPCLSASFACYLAFYRGVRMDGQHLTGLRGEEEYSICDDTNVLSFFCEHREDSPEAFVHAVCSNESFWGEDLSRLPGFEAQVLKDYRTILAQGTLALMKLKSSVVKKTTFC